MKINRKKDAERRPFVLRRDQRQAIAAIVTAAAARMEVTTMSVMAVSPFCKVLYVSVHCYLVAMSATTTAAAAAMTAVMISSILFLLSSIFPGFLCPPSTPVQ